MKKRNPFHKRFLSVAECTRRSRRTLFSILVFGVFLSGCSGLFGEEVEQMTPAAEEFTFDQYEVITGSAKRQTVLTGFLLGGTIAELAVVHIDENDNRHLRIYAFSDGTWAPKLDQYACETSDRFDRISSRWYYRSYVRNSTKCCS